MRYYGKHRPRGFSEKPAKSISDVLFGLLGGIDGREKRQLLNDLSAKIAAAAGVAAVILVTVLAEESLGLACVAAAGIVAGGAMLALVVNWLVGGRYCRP